MTAHDEKAAPMIFTQGQSIDIIILPNGTEIGGKGWPYPVTIEVVMEYGQMACVPWAVVKSEYHRPRKYNLANVLGVVMPKQERSTSD